MDAVIFGHDKFAFEMVHFVKGAADKIKSESTNIADVWEANFVQVSHGISPIVTPAGPIATTTMRIHVKRLSIVVIFKHDFII